MRKLFFFTLLVLVFAVLAESCKAPRDANGHKKRKSGMGWM